MGLASSQARLLNLTTRMHQIEYKAAKLEAQKLQMANESRKAYLDYQNAMEKTKIQLKSLTTNASATFVDATVNRLAENGYKIICTNPAFFKDIVPIGTKTEQSSFIKNIERIDNETAINEGYILVSSAQEFVNIINGNESAKIMLTNDLDFSDYIGRDSRENYIDVTIWGGEINGNGYYLKNVQTDLFSTVYQSTIKNIGVEFNDAGWAAISKDVAESNFENCVFKGSISAMLMYFGEKVSLDSVYIDLDVDDAFSTLIESGSEVNISNSYILGRNGYNYTYQDTHRTAGLLNYGDLLNISNTVINIVSQSHNFYELSSSENINCNLDNVIINSSYGIPVYSGNYNSSGLIEMTGEEISDYIRTNYKGGNIISSSDTDIPDSCDITDLIPEQYRNDVEYLTNLVLSGYIVLSRPDSKGEYVDVSVATDTDLQEVADESDLRKAEAKYEADMRRIDYKDRKYDYDLAALEAERNAIKNEIETLKTVAKDNVERTFKLFS